MEEILRQPRSLTTLINLAEIISALVQHLKDDRRRHAGLQVVSLDMVGFVGTLTTGLFQ
jgi:hypothetical protein